MFFKKTAYVIFIFVFAASFLFFIPFSVAEDKESSIEQLIKEKIEKGFVLEGDIFHTPLLLQSFYEGRQYHPIWIKKENPSSLALEMKTLISEVGGEGLDPQNYHNDSIEYLFNAIEKTKNSNERLPLLAELELLLTDAFFSIGTHFSYGAVNPYDRVIRWYPPSGGDWLKTVLDSTVKNRKISPVVKDMLPKTPEYEALKEKLYEFEKLKSEGVLWTKIDALPKNKKIIVGDRDNRMPLIKKRLGIVKEIGHVVPEELLYYDEKTRDAVVKFQREHGLLEDGVIGFRTLEAMNVPLERRIDQIKVNLDRQRALASILSEKRKIVVNIPAFWLAVYEEAKPVLEMKVITGMPKRKTPMLSSEVRHLIFSPKWFVPDTILFEDKLPYILKDPAYLERHRMKVYHKRGGRVEPEEIDWSQINSKYNIPYRVVQDSGDANALGRVKFIFPNRHDVYMHDTPQKELFSNANRAFSSGCIRIEKPVELAELLLKDKPDWNREKIITAMHSNNEQIVYLTKAIPIHIIYMTAWVDNNGVMNFREDIYGYDENYKRLLYSVKRNNKSSQQKDLP